MEVCISVVRNMSLAEDLMGATEVAEGVCFLRLRVE